MDWRDLTPDGRVEAIKAVWEDGMSSKQIACALPYHGVSRNAVIGILHRHKAKLTGIHLQPFGSNGWVKGQPRKPRKSRAKSGGERLPRPAPRPRIKMVSPSILFEHVPSKPLPEPAFVPGERLTVGRPIHMLGHGECRWAVNDADKGEMALFCGAQCTGSWCSFHARLVYKPIGFRTERLAA